MNQPVNIAWSEKGVPGFLHLYYNERLYTFRTVVRFLSSSKDR